MAYLDFEVFFLSFFVLFPGCKGLDDDFFAEYGVKCLRPRLGALRFLKKLPPFCHGSCRSEA